MASSLKVVLRKKGKQDGTYPLALRVTLDRKSTYIYLGHDIKESDWDVVAQKVKKSHPNSVQMNNFILKKKAEANDKMLNMGAHEKDISVKAIRNQIKPKVGASFFAQAAVYCEDLKMCGKFNQRSADEPRIQQFKTFLGGSDISFAEINPALLLKFKAYLIGKRTISERTAVNHLVIIRTIFNRAIVDGLVDQKYYPFGKGRISIKFPDSLKIGLTVEEVKALEQLELPAGENHARNLWMVSFYFAGMRISDVLRLKWSDFQNDRLYYAMGKNLKTGSLKVPTKVWEILEQYPKGVNAHDLVFPDLAVMPDLTKAYEVQSYIKTRIKSGNDYLKKVAAKLELTKSLSMHIARHSFAQISADRIPANILQRLYRHSDIKTTMGYQSNFITKTTDDALDAVINL
ncbi:site-specific integrase [Dyadobacter sp. LHD-138]|uniref:site-specific integrase n=1 Tax=Dyadobacter sp. LHD-138 TaxID=3071413 RepID=UPI0027E0DA03|nr:site-specific integrase [Dyadobacter sp. LHD-138]MDQ6478867.1 site-specific integrase [Dyadobacter sp. LHD-138]